MSSETTVSRRELARRFKGEPNAAIFCMKISIWVGLIVAGGVLALSQSWALCLIGTALLGTMFAHGVEIQHQVLHGQGLENAVAHEAAGIALGVPMLVSYADYQASHLKHHRYLGTSDNTEFFDYGDQYGDGVTATVGVWANRLLMPSHYLEFVKGVYRAIVTKDDERHSSSVNRRVRRDHRIILSLLIVAVGTSIVVGSTAILWLWVIPMALIAIPIHALIELPEHYQCNTDSTDVLENTRTISTHPLLIWFTNGNNFHAEHHLLPSLPIDRLHDLHREIGDQVTFRHSSYRDFFQNLCNGELVDKV